jgi:hypothetical protein
LAAEAPLGRSVAGSRRTGSRVVRRAAFALLLASAACAEQSDERRVRLVLDSEPAIPAAADEVIVEVTASRTEAGNTCLPAVHVFPLAAAWDLPIEIAYVPGPRYDEWVAFRVTWRRSGRDVARRVAISAFPDEGIRELPLLLETACLSRSCGAGEQCDAGMCVPLPSPDPFDPGLRDAGQACETP